MQFFNFRLQTVSLHPQIPVWDGAVKKWRKRQVAQLTFQKTTLVSLGPGIYGLRKEREKEYFLTTQRLPSQFLSKGTFSLNEGNCPILSNK